MADGQRRLGALLLEMGVLDELELERALEAQRRSGRRLGRLLVESGVVEEDILVRALARQLGVERWDPGRQPSEASARALVARDSAIRARTLPLARITESGRDTLVLATSDPLAPMAGKVVRSLVDRGWTVRWLLAGEREMEVALRLGYGSSGEENSAPSSAGARSSSAGEGDVSAGADRSSGSGVTVIRGRPERPPGGASGSEDERSPSTSLPARPARSTTAPTTRPPSPVETELVEALDAALGEDAGHPVLQDRSASVIHSRLAPALSVGTAKATGQTLVADDAVLEVVDVLPNDVGNAKEPASLGLEEHGAAVLGSERSSLRPARVRPRFERPPWARAARTQSTNWGELVPSEPTAPDEGAEATTPIDENSRPPPAGPSPRPDGSDSEASTERNELPPAARGASPPPASGSSESVALARLAIRRADGGVREVMSEDAKHRDHRDDGPSPVREADIPKVLSQSPPRPRDLNDVDRSPSPYESARKEPKAVTSSLAGGEAHGPPSLAATHVELIEEVARPEDVERSLSEEDHTKDIFDNEPTYTGEPADDPGSPEVLDVAANETTEQLVRSRPVPSAQNASPQGEGSRPDERSDKRPTMRSEVAGLGRERSAEAPVSRRGPEEEASTRLTVDEARSHPPLETELPIEAPEEAHSAAGQDAPGVDDEPTPEDRASELHARLIRFASGEELPERLEPDVLRVVVRALLDHGLVDEPLILDVLEERKPR